MKIIVHLTLDGKEEYRLEGNAPIFDSHIVPWLGDIGFWLDEWKYAGKGGYNHKWPAFIPWGSALFMERLQ